MTDLYNFQNILATGHMRTSIPKIICIIKLCPHLVINVYYFIKIAI
jgi:hypothetical protein